LLKRKIIYTKVMKRMYLIADDILGREIRTITHRYNCSMKWKSTRSSSLWKLTFVRTCFLQFIGAWKN